MAGTQGREQMFFKILVFFAVVTAITAIFNLSQSGAMTIHNFGSSDVLPGQAVPNIQTPDLPGYSVNSSITEQNYMLSTGYDPNVTIIKGGWLALGPLWTQADGVGMTCTNTPLFPPFTQSSLLIKGVKATNNIYSVTYTIDSGGKEFYTIVYSSNPPNIGLFIRFDTTGLHIRDELTPLDDIFYQGANNAHIIRSDYNSVQKYVDIWLDGAYAGRFTKLSVGIPKNSPFPTNIYAGVSTYQTGVIVEKIETLIQPEAPTPGPLDILLASFNAIMSFASLIAVSLGMTTNPAVPFWLWAIVGLPCVATTILIYIEIIRGN